jgi:hypothetical protein
MEHGPPRCGGGTTVYVITLFRDGVLQVTNNPLSVIKSMPWRCAKIIHSFGCTRELELKATIQTCLYFIGLAADSLRVSDIEIGLTNIQIEPYNTVLGALEFWTQSARTKAACATIMAEQQFQNLFEHYWPRSTTFHH